MEANNELKTFPSWFQEHPTTQKIIKEKQNEIKEQHKLAFSELNTLRTEHKEKLKVLNYKITKTEKALEFSQQEAKRAAQDHQKSKGEKTAESINFSNRIARLETTLQETADPLIEEAIKYFNERLDTLRKPEAIKQQNFPGKKDIHTEKRRPFGYSNHGALTNCIAFLQGAIQAAQELKLQDLTGEDIKKRLAELKTNAPDPDALTYYGDGDEQ